MARPTGMRGLFNQPAALPLSNGPYVTDQAHEFATVTASTFNCTGDSTTSGDQTITGDLTLTGHKDGQILLLNSFNNINSSDWTLQTTGVIKLPLNKAHKIIAVPLPVKVGDEIVGWRVLGGMTGVSGSDVYLDSFLQRVVKTAGSAYTTESFATALTVTANVARALDNGSALTTVHTVAADYNYFIAVTATTPNTATSTISVQGVELDVNRK